MIGRNKMVKDNGEFRGSTKQSLKDISEDVKSLQTEVAALRRWLTVLTILLTLAVVERVPDFIKVITAVASGG